MDEKSRLRKQNKTLLEKAKKLKIQKMHLDYIAGLLSIPLIVMGLIINFGNISKHKSSTDSITPTPQVIIVPGKTTPQQVQQVVQPTNSPSCKKSIGPLSISHPEEGSSVNDNPVCINIDYSDETYCSVVWSYRFNNGSWSEFNNNAPCLYNLPSGKVSFQLRVNSTVSSESKTFNRNFNYAGSSQPTPASSSAQ